MCVESLKVSHGHAVWGSVCQISQESCPNRQCGGGGSGRSPKVPRGPERPPIPNCHVPHSSGWQTHVTCGGTWNLASNYLRPFPWHSPSPFSSQDQEMTPSQPWDTASLGDRPWSQERTVVEGAGVLQCPSDAALHWSFQSLTQSLAGLFLGYLLPSSKMLPEPAESDCFTTTTCCVWAAGLEI